MVKSKRRAWVIVGLLALALVAVAVPLAEPVWEWVTVTRRVGGGGGLMRFGDEDSMVVMVRWRNRWTGGLMRYGYFHRDTGFLATHNQVVDGTFRLTAYFPDGRVHLQRSRSAHPPFHEETRTAPPWWWGVKDQTSPSDPQWIAEHGK